MPVLYMIGLILMLPLPLFIVGSTCIGLLSNLSRKEFICLILFLLFLVGLVIAGIGTG